MERLSDLFFELSHENRLEILGMLMSGPTKLTHIASKMDNSSQEAHRHLSRLPLTARAKFRVLHDSRHLIDP
jgi:predicted transcriptional regulator